MFFKIVSAYFCTVLAFSRQEFDRDSNQNYEKCSHACRSTESQKRSSNNHSKSKLEYVAYRDVVYLYVIKPLTHILKNVSQGFSPLKKIIIVVFLHKEIIVVVLHKKKNNSSKVF